MEPGSYREKAIIIGAGPAGLTASYQLLTTTGIKPIVLEASDRIGGISTTIDYKGNRIDLGGHRFFSKSDRVIQWWLNIFPLQRTAIKTAGDDVEALFPEIDASLRRYAVADPELTDRVFLVRKRRSRILFSGKLFDYPVTLGLKTLTDLGLTRSLKVTLSYLGARVFPIREVKNLEQFLINRFGRELYRIFFKDYTEKVWGVSCTEIEPEWGAQRIKGVSFSEAVRHALKKAFARKASILQKDTETSLIEWFLYPKYGPGQLWDEVARIVREKGGEIHLKHQVVGLDFSGNRIKAVIAKDLEHGKLVTLKGEHFISSMPVKELIRAMGEGVPLDVIRIAEGLPYRDFITVGLLLKDFFPAVDRKRRGERSRARDNWIYIQEPGVRACRLQIFNNWSPYMVAVPDRYWVGIEYICSHVEQLWKNSDDELLELASREMERIGLIRRGDVVDGTVIRVLNAYPAYHGTYEKFHLVREYLDGFENLYLVGRNGMHRYNNQDHSMLTAMAAVENIIQGRRDKDNIWSVNAEGEYLESR